MEGTMSSTETRTVPAPTLDGDHDRFAHIIDRSRGPSAIESAVNGVAVKTLCGIRLVQGRDPKKFPVCPSCKEIAEGRGWKVPT